jgi:hypothetical protein
LTAPIPQEAPCSDLLLACECKKDTGLYATTPRHRRSAKTPKLVCKHKSVFVNRRKGETNYHHKHNNAVSMFSLVQMQNIQIHIPMLTNRHIQMYTYMFIIHIETHI